MNHLNQPFKTDPDQVSALCGLSCPEPTLAKSEFHEESDINVIMSRALRSGVMPPQRDVEPRYGDVTVFMDRSYQQHLQTVIDGQVKFDALPLEEQKAYGNLDGMLDSLDKQAADAAIAAVEAAKQPPEGGSSQQAAGGDNAGK